jgi:anti-sigma B factor antagonist
MHQGHATDECVFAGLGSRSLTTRDVFSMHPADLPEFQTRVERCGTTAVVHVRGELDLYAAPRLHDELLDVLGQAHDALIVDLAEVSFIDSSGLGILVASLKRAQNVGTVLWLRSPERQVMRALEITHLSSVFPIK